MLIPHTVQICGIELLHALQLYNYIGCTDHKLLIMCHSYHTSTIHLVHFLDKFGVSRFSNN